MRRMRVIDPGKNCGVATFVGDTLTSVFVCDGDLLTLAQWDSDLVIEVPRIYPGGRGKGDPNQIVDLAYQAGRIAGSAPFATIRRVFPAQWKGQVDPDVMCSRILGFLSCEEEALFLPIPKGIRHNAIDAAGLGLWILGLMGRGGRP